DVDDVIVEEESEGDEAESSDGHESAVADDGTSADEWPVISDHDTVEDQIDEDQIEDVELAETNELIPDEMFAADSVDTGEYRDPEVMEPDSDSELSPLVMSDTTEDFTAGLLDGAPSVPDEAPTVEHAAEESEADEIVAEEPVVEDIDEVHALVAETVASFEPSETDDLPGSGVTASEAAEAGATASRGGLTSLFSSFVPRGKDSGGSELLEEPTSESDGGAGGGLLAAAGVGTVGLAASGLLTEDEVDTSIEMPAAESDAGTDTAVAETPARRADDELVTAEEVEDHADSTEQITSERQPIDVPQEAASDPLESARYLVNTENVVLLIDGDPVAAMGWPSVDRIEQRRNLVHYLSVMAGTSGSAPDVLLDRDFGVDRLPDSRSVRVRVTNEGGSVTAQIVSLIDSYPNEWPVVVVSDNMDLAAEAAMKGATIMENGQLLDLFIAP
ncbi:MAG: hypothetical protein ACN4GZ_19900, partial [Acidimicrobiales bacterium]